MLVNVYAANLNSLSIAIDGMSVFRNLHAMMASCENMAVYYHHHLVYYHGTVITHSVQIMATAGIKVDICTSLLYS
jgi:hypothetical protein